jgi:hypothetical protein
LFPQTERVSTNVSNRRSPDHRNKQELISFLGEFISKFVNADNPLPVGHTLYLAGTCRNPEVAKKIAGDQDTISDQNCKCFVK